MKGSTVLVVVGSALLVGIGVLLASKSAPAAQAPRQGKTLPWVPPGLGAAVPVLAKSRDTSTTAFPIDEWTWNAGGAQSFILVVASDDPTSYVALSDTPDAIPTILQMGPGQHSVQIAEQL